MQDQPTLDELLGGVIDFLRETVVPEAKPRTAFQARVAASTLELVWRQIEFGAPAEEQEKQRLIGLLGVNGDLAELNEQLADALADGRLDVQSPGVARHLRATTLEKLAVDQPHYSGYRAALREAAETAKDS
ncbi:hypothetical protein FHR22_002474 [Sphingopyxis panaciterrae]|uniref:DUF6285 domain-containing protein n=1 Tax=Sphingopyxis panaciterrae TaxID=363841 RepID=UPI001420CFC1|nr:DUF6285 domain-containing protein [Sphingopyxis panaciterrae]NIJ37771.1 hypothetical protein [Sphingopyxis panaciterrae]